MKTLVAMLIICWAPKEDGTLKEAWRIEQTVALGHCLTMNRVFAGGGSAAAITVRCGAPRGGSGEESKIP